MRTRRKPKRPSHAVVVAYLALFVALGGASYAAIKLPKNSVGTKQLRKNAVKGSKVAKDSLSGSDINESTLGTVPRAASSEIAGDAQALGGLSAAQLTDASKVRCPGGTEPAAGVCFETSPSSSAELFVAMRVCAQGDRRLPSQNELMAYADKVNIAPPGEWAEPIFVDSVQQGALITSSVAGPTLAVVAASTSHTYRCVTPASN